MSPTYWKRRKAKRLERSQKGRMKSKTRKAAGKASLDPLVGEINAEIKRIEADERYSYPPANVQVNVVLALIQVDMKSRVGALRWVLYRIANIVIGGDGTTAPDGGKETR